ncbi:pre-rRNA-processing protein TSR2 homolog isoform X1 [Telopea speciosissima]|uniref:pre-rRNA-processing protein TSR2 homolog isoform X1 n=1 Tax=Telopea speciosissima TaxID=54955 RepID=UPI001CC7C695|nr:pre-rRNA-processing protein TSR2 homolog isoform X1 [Telopea speciosissima]
MDSAKAGPVPAQLSPEALSVFAEGISLLLSRWTSLQMAVQNEWGGRNSRQKSDQLATDLMSWFSQSKEPLYIDDLENMLDETMMLSFNAEIEDGSVEEVAEQLMIMHEDCLQGNCESVEKLRKSSSGAEAVSRSRQMVNDDDGDDDGDDDDDDDDDESSDDGSSNMVMDELKPTLNPKPEPMSVDVQRPRETVEAEDGWTVVGPRRNKGKRN